ncbi:MAG: hypothetical protein J4O08_04810, partial [Chloroflexi bacterium]|nr:hypothetical protein [Chloroflexota bacterium]
MSPRKKLRTTPAVLASVTALALAPDPRIRVSYNLMVGLFALSLAITPATPVVLNPSPSDPRNLLRRRGHDVGNEENTSSTG